MAQKSEHRKEHPNVDFTDTVVWAEANNELDVYAAPHNDSGASCNDETVEIASLLTDIETDALLSRGKRPLRK